jgi:hypothetical protein
MIAEGLLILLQSLTRCTEWPDVEIRVSRAVAILVTFETDFSMLMRKSNEILTAMHLLLLKGPAAMVEELKTSRQESSGLAPATCSFLASDGEEAEPPSIADVEDAVRDLVSAAVSHICSIVRSHWEKEAALAMESAKEGSSTDRPADLGPGAASALDDSPFPPAPALKLHRSQSGGGKQKDARAAGSGALQLTCAVLSRQAHPHFLLCRLAVRFAEKFGRHSPSNQHT